MFIPASMNFARVNTDASYYIVYFSSITTQGKGSIDSVSIEIYRYKSLQLFLCVASSLLLSTL